jgi:hypothetical protein
MYGGATNALHLISFGSAFGFQDREFVHPLNVQRTLHHFWKPAESMSVKVCSGFPVVDGDQQRPLTFTGCLRVEGLFCVSTPCIEVCGPSVFHPGKLVRRQLSRAEFMAVYDVPAALYDTFLQRCQWICTEPLLFEHAVSPVIVTSLFRQLWSNIGGVSFLSGDDRFEPAPPLPVLEAEGGN